VRLGGFQPKFGTWLAGSGDFLDAVASLNLIRRTDLMREADGPKASVPRRSSEQAMVLGDCGYVNEDVVDVRE